VTEGCTNAELQQQLQKAYSCEKSEEQMMGTVNDDEKKLSFDEEMEVDESNQRKFRKDEILQSKMGCMV
jgi:hypothetical protein